MSHNAAQYAQKKTRKHVHTGPPPLFSLVLFFAIGCKGVYRPNLKPAIGTRLILRVRTAQGSRDLAEDQLLETPVLPGFQVKVQASLPAEIARSTRQFSA